MITDVDISFLPDLEEEVFAPDIVQLGNYFIMDSEQLVSNPFAELQQEAVSQANNDSQKRQSMTEKLTSVKNNVCENHFHMAQSRLEREKASRLKQLHHNSDKLRHEVKLLDLDKQRHQVEIKRRLDPKRDHSYDISQVSNTEKRLGANIASFYLDRRLKYPVRIRSVNDITLTPTIQRARASLRQTEQQKSCDDTPMLTNDNSRRDSRAQTAKSASSSIARSNTSNSPPRYSSLLRRRDSRSAPNVYARATDRKGGASAHGNRSRGSAKGGGLLPAIPLTSHQQRGQGNKAPWSQPAADRQGRTSPPSSNSNQTSTTQVKFAFENPLKILTSNEESNKLFTQPNASYYPGATRAVHHRQHSHIFSDSDNDDDDDADIGLPDRIDLKAMFFNDNDANNNHDNTSEDDHDGDIAYRGVHRKSSTNSMSAYQLAMLKKAQGPPPRLTTDMMQVEMDKINSKVKSFMTNLTRSQTTLNSRKFSLIEELAEAEKHSIENAMLSNSQRPPPRLSSKGTNTSDGQTQQTPAAETESKTNPLKSASTSNLPQTTVVQKTEHNVNNGESDHVPNAGSETDLTEQQQQQQKYSWKLIRGQENNTNIWNEEDEQEQNAASQSRPEDLVLQALTGIPIRDALHTHVPLHSASRALRHTATYKMHKIVERLINDRTKYQRHQVDELKKQMCIDENNNGAGGVISGVLEGGGVAGGPTAQRNSFGGSDNQRTSRVSISSGGSDKRKLAAR